MANVLVTGGAGFIGSHVSRELIQMDHKVVVLDDLSGGFADNVDPRCEFIVASVCDHDRLPAIFSRYRFRYVFHLAAYAAEGLSHFIKRFNHRNNLIGTVNLLNEAVKHDVRCFVFASSIAVYGESPTPMDEGMVPQPIDSYGIAKYAAELELRASERIFGLPYIIFRPHNVYGEGQNIGDRYRNVIGIFMNQVMLGLPMTIFGDGQQTRAFSYIADVAPLIARSIAEPRAYNKVFNVGGDQPYTVKYVAELVAEAMGCAARITYLDRRHEVEHAFCDHHRLKEVFHPGSPTPLDIGIARMATWAKRIGPRQSRRFDEIEIVKNLPASWSV
jgi:UDP-glucose 4-epimerase